MNKETFNIKESTVAILIVATISVLFVVPSGPTIPAYALGHWHEGVESSGEDGTDNRATEDQKEMESSGDDGTDNRATEDRKELVSCLADTKEGSIPTPDEIKDCLNTVRGGEEDTEDDTSITDDDRISIRDDDPENSDRFNSIG